MRYLPLSEHDRGEMLAAVGVPDVGALFVDVGRGAPVRAHRRAARPRQRNGRRTPHGPLTESLTAGEVPFFLGAGAYRHHVPASVDHLIQRGEFLTAYTPTSPKSRKARFRFSSSSRRRSRACSEPTWPMPRSTTVRPRAGKPSPWPGASRAAPAVLSGGLHPHYVGTAQTMARFTGDRLVTALPDADRACR
jgi:glycine dehydrogenase subunit 1